MANFLIISRIGPTKHFFGCLPIRVGIFFIFLIHVGILIADLFEHLKIFDGGDKLVNQWVTFSIQCAVSVLILIDLIIKHQLLSLITYFVLLLSTAAITAEKITKIVYISDNLSLKVLLVTSTTKPIHLALVYAWRSFGEFVLYFYITYIAYSYSQEGNDEKYAAREEFVKK